MGAGCSSLSSFGLGRRKRARPGSHKPATALHRDSSASSATMKATSDVPPSTHRFVEWVSFEAFVMSCMPFLRRRDIRRT